MDFNGNTVINDQFVPVPDKSELMYVFPFPADTGLELYWSLPVFPGKSKNHGLVKLLYCTHTKTIKRKSYIKYKSNSTYNRRFNH